MSANKYIILCIIFFMVMPFNVMFGQEMEGDTTESELDIKYDSVLEKAASSLADSAFNEAIEYYRQASTLKPTETYPYKMISYVESTSREVAAKQKRADELKRKAQIRDNLNKANQAIFDRNWDTAKFLFNEILTLSPEKGDEEYAKAKIEAIDLELKRIALRTPVKEEPPVVILPKNRREARAQRKVAERNMALSSVSNKATTQKPIGAMKTSSVSSTSAQKVQKSTASSTPGNTVASVKKISYQILQRFNEDFKDATNINWTVSSKFAKADFFQDEEKVEAFYDLDGVLIGTSRYISIYELPKEVKKIFASKYAQYNINEVIRYEGPEEAAYYISTEDDKEKVVFRLTGSKDISVFSRGLAEKNAAGSTKGISPAEVAQANKTAVAAPPAKETAQQTTQAQLPDRKVAVTAPPSAKETPQPAAQSSIPDTIAAPPPARETPQQPAQSSTPDRKVAIAAPPPARETPQQPTQSSIPDSKAGTAAPLAKGIEQKPAELPVAKNMPSAEPAAKEIVQKPPVTSLPADRKVATAPSAKEAAQKSAEDPLAEPSPEKRENRSAGPPVLNLYDSSNYVKLICQDISFIGSNAYIKVLIQNYSTTANFLTDTLQVSIRNNNGVIKKLDQRFISNFPVVKPQDETVLVFFADASIAVGADDTFILEMEDKMKQTKLVIQVPWSAYKQQKNL